MALVLNEECFDVVRLEEFVRRSRFDVVLAVQMEQCRFRNVTFSRQSRRFHVVRHHSIRRKDVKLEFAQSEDTLNRLLVQCGQQLQSLRNRKECIMYIDDKDTLSFDSQKYSFGFKGWISLRGG